MHKPEYGTYPLVLRNHDTIVPVRGEFLLNYGNYEMYSCDIHNGSVLPLSGIVYNKLKQFVLDKSNLVYSKSNVDVSRREVNTFLLINDSN